MKLIPAIHLSNPLLRVPRLGVFQKLVLDRIWCGRKPIEIVLYPLYYRQLSSTPNVTICFILLKERAWTGQAGIQRSQCVHVGSSITTKRFDRSNASTGQIETHAAQPKQRPSSNDRISPARLGIGCWGGFHTQTHPDPFVSFGIYFLSRRSDRKRVSAQLAIFIEPIPLLAHSHWVLLVEPI